MPFSRWMNGITALDALSAVGGRMRVEQRHACQSRQKRPCLHFRAEHLTAAYLSLRAATPGSVLPSRYSSEAPPPVEMWLISAALPLFFTADTESPPPMIESPPFAFTVATASHTPNVPLARGANSKQPIGPFQTTVFAALMASEKRATDLGPMSRPIQPSSEAGT